MFKIILLYIAIAICMQIGMELEVAQIQFCNELH